MINGSLTVVECASMLCPECYTCTTCLGWGIVLGIAVVVLITYFTEEKGRRSKK